MSVAGQIAPAVTVSGAMAVARVDRLSCRPASGEVGHWGAAPEGAHRSLRLADQNPVLVSVRITCTCTSYGVPVVRFMIV